MQYQTISIPLGAGEDSKTVKEMTPDGKLDLLENAYQAKTGGLKKRHGYRSLSKDVIPGTGGISSTNGRTQWSSVMKPKALASRNGSLLMNAETSLLAYAPGIGSWTDQGRFNSVGVQAMPIDGGIRGGNDNEQIHDVAVRDGLAAFAFMDPPSSYGTSIVKASVIDIETGAKIIHRNGNVNLGTVSEETFVRVLAFPDVFVYLVADRPNNDIDLFTYTVSTDTFSTATNVASAMAATSHFDAVAISDAHFLLAYGTTASLLFFDLLTVAGSSVDTMSSASRDVVSISLSAGAKGTVNENRVGVAWFDTNPATDAVKAAVVDVSDVTTLAWEQTATTVIASGTSAETDVFITPDYATPSGSSPASGDNLFRVYYGTGTVGSDRVISAKTLQKGGTLASTGTTAKGVSMVAKPWTTDDGVYFIANYQDDTNSNGQGLQPTSFLFRDPVGATDEVSTNGRGDIVARWFVAEAGNYTRRASSVTVDGDTVYTSMMFNSAVEWALGADVFSTLSLVSVDYNKGAMTVAGDGDHAVLGGALVYSFDEDRITENGFHVYPENVGAANASGGSVATGDYSVKVIWKYRDADGLVHRSHPSDADAVTVSTNAITVAPFDITNSTAGFTERRLSQQAPWYEMYSTDEGPGSLYYQATDRDSTKRTEANATLITRPLLYTTGGVLGNITPPTPVLIHGDGKRMFLVPCDHRDRLWISKPLEVGIAAEFNDTLVLQVPGIGNITAVGTMDNRHFIFGRDNIRWIAGPGPNALGQNMYDQIQSITTDTGCVDHRSMILTPEGLMYQSPRGIYMLNRSLQTVYVGAAVEKYNDARVIDAQLDKSRTLARFLLDNGKSLIYDYFHKGPDGLGTWSVRNEHQAIDAAVWSGGYAYLRSDGTVMTEDAEFRDAGDDYRMEIATKWINMAGVMGYQRVRQAGIAGEYRSPHDLKVEVFVDYDDTAPVQTVVIPSEKVETTVGKPYLARIKLERQKCTAIKFKLTDIPKGGDGESLRLSAISLEVGAKGGMSRLSPDRSR